MLCATLAKNTQTLSKACRMFAGISNIAIFIFGCFHYEASQDHGTMTTGFEFALFATYCNRRDCDTRGSASHVVLGTE